MTTPTRPALLSAMAYMLQAAGITPAELAQHMGMQREQRLLSPLVEPGVDIDAAHAALAKPTNPREKRQARVISPTVQAIEALIARPGGALVVDVQKAVSINQQSANGHLLRLIQDGQAVRVRAPGEQALRYFGRQSDADAYVQSLAGAKRTAKRPQAPAPAPQPRAVLSPAEIKALATAEKKRAAARKSAPPLGQRTQRQPPTKVVQPARDSMPAPVVIAERNVGAKARGEAIETPATSRTIDNTKRPNSRVEAAPALPPDPRWPSFSSTRPGQNPDTGRPWA